LLIVHLLLRANLLLHGKLRRMQLFLGQLLYVRLQQALLHHLRPRLAQLPRV
jgi:hypothetical protein